MFENGRTANNVAEAPNLFDVSPAPYADLAVTAFTAPSVGASGSFIDLSWTVVNQSPHAIGATNTSSWSDTVYLTSDAAGKNVVATLGQFSHVGALAIGGSYTRDVQAPIPITLSGNYYVVVKTGGPYEFIYTDNDARVSGPIAISLSSGPDLVPTHIAATAPGSTQVLTSVTAGDSIDINWTVRNVGGDATDASYIDAVILTQLGTGQTTVLGGFTSPGTLGGGRQLTRTEQVTVPETLSGQFQLSIETNAGFFPIYETATNNDSLVDADELTVVAPKRPDLQVASIDDSPLTTNSGGTVSLKYKVINQGNAEASGHWQDAVYLSYVDHFDSSAIRIGTIDNPEALAVGQFYVKDTGDLAVPKRLGGAAYLIVVTNVNASVDEYPHGDNNTFVKPITIIAEPPADLVTSKVIAPDQVYDGATLTVTYHVDNLGLEPTDKTTWTDSIWLTHDKTRPNPSKGDVLLTTVVHNGVIGNDPSVVSPPTGYDVTATVTLPVHISGQYYITAWSDMLDAVYKSTQSTNVNPDDPTQVNNDNYKARPITVLLTPPPDLVVTSVTPQATAVGGDDYTVSWTVQNQGAHGTDIGPIFDQVYLSDTPVFVPPNTGKDVGNQWLLGSVEHDGGLTSGSSYTASALFHLAPEISGKYIIVVANTGDQYHAPTWEGPYTDNDIATAVTHVTPLPLADLRVVSVVGSAPNYSGEMVTATWTVQNFGAPVWSGTQYWQDSLYFSRYPTFDPNNAKFVGNFAHATTTSLATGDSYTASATFTLPQGIGGTADDPQTYYLYVIADFGGAVKSNSRVNSDAYNSFTRRGYEDITNNLGSGQLPVIYREPDLKVSDLQMPTAPIKSGDLITLSWTVKNIGNRDTRNGGWFDRVFLSQDPSLDSSDTELDEVRHDTILKTGDEYTVTRTFQLPDGLGGDYYLLVFTDSIAGGRIGYQGVYGVGSDSMGAVAEFQGEGNNITSAPMTIAAVAAPDLQVKSVAMQGPDASDPDHVLAGETYSVTYTVVNAGQGPTAPRQSKWSDYVYLSRDQVLSDSDIFLGEETHEGGLDAGASYIEDADRNGRQRSHGPVVRDRGHRSARYR